MTLKGIIMAGGIGTRFRPLTNYFQKCMIPIGDKEKPILEYIVRLFRYHSVDDLVLLVGYKHQQIENYFDHGERFGVKMQYILDNPDLKGSANAILNAYIEGAITEKDTLLIYYGDIISNVNLAELVEFHESHGALATVALAPGFNVSVGTAAVDDGWIKEFKEKPTLETPVSIGVLVVSGEVLPLMRQLHDEGQFESFDLMGDVIQYLVNRDMKVSGYVSDAFWYDVGSIEKYDRLSHNRLSEELGFLL